MHQFMLCLVQLGDTILRNTMINIHTLRIPSCENITVGGISELQNLIQLRQLDVRNCLNFIALASLPSRLQPNDLALIANCDSVLTHLTLTDTLVES
jgi:hypothetical protein